MFWNYLLIIVIVEIWWSIGSYWIKEDIRKEMREMENDFERKLRDLKNSI